MSEFKECCSRLLRSELDSIAVPGSRQFSPFPVPEWHDWVPFNLEILGLQNC